MTSTDMQGSRSKMSNPMKRVLITAGPVYGPLDANKLVGNRTRGIWSVKFADTLALKGYPVTLLVADTFNRAAISPRHNLTVLTHNGFDSYHEQCKQLAKTHDVAIMAAAVVNWIPRFPYPGKMPTKGYDVGDEILVPFYLAPRVIDDMKVANPKLTLIGCKMLVSSPHEELIEQAYELLLRAKCNMVIANDMGHGLKKKFFVNQDRSVQTYDNDFDRMFYDLIQIIEDEHYHTVFMPHRTNLHPDSAQMFDAIVAKYRSRFVHRQAGSDKVFGAIYLPEIETEELPPIRMAVVSPREKGALFSSKDAVILSGIHGREVRVIVQENGLNKATLNAPLLAQVSQKYPSATAILHLHEQLPSHPIVPYAPPGTVRDNERDIIGPVFNIEGHGFIACLDKNLEIW